MKIVYICLAFLVVSVIGLIVEIHKSRKAEEDEYNTNKKNKNKNEEEK